MQWEYKTAVMTHGFMGMNRGEIDRSLMADALGTLGGEGWELVWVFVDQALHKEKDGHLLLFKRPLPVRKRVPAVPTTSLTRT